MKRQLELNKYDVQELSIEDSREIIGGGEFWKKVGNFFADLWEGFQDAIWGSDKKT